VFLYIREKKKREKRINVRTNERTIRMHRIHTHSLVVLPFLSLSLSLSFSLYLFLFFSCSIPPALSLSLSLSFFLSLFRGDCSHEDSQKTVLVPRSTARHRCPLMPGDAPTRGTQFDVWRATAHPAIRVCARPDSHSAVAHARVSSGSARHPLSRDLTSGTLRRTRGADAPAHLVIPIEAFSLTSFQVAWPCDDDGSFAFSIQDPSINLSSIIIGLISIGLIKANVFANCNVCMQPIE